MKKLAILFVLLLISGSVYTQAWKMYLPANKRATELTYYDYKNAFNTWCQVTGIDQTGFFTNAKGERQKAYGWKQFKRWEIQMDGWYDHETGRFLIHEVNKEILRVKKERASNPRNIIGNWTPVAYSQEGSGNDGNGRINCIAFHPTNPNVFWVGTAWGGIWKTENHGESWTPLSDDIMTLGIGSIAIPSNYDQSQTIYLGTGDRGYNRDFGRGILKSTDGGQTWQPTGLCFDTLVHLYINRLSFVPGTTNQLIACTDEGIFKSADGFQTWDTLYTCFGVDMEFNPGNPNIIYVSTRMVDKKTKIIRSENGGLNWNTVVSTYGVRTELAVSPDEPSWVYAVVADTLDSFKEFLKSENNGISFDVAYDGNNILGGDCYGLEGGGQGNYDLAIAANPLNANDVYVGGINVWKSTTGGTTWSINANGYHNCLVPMNVHVDIHWLDFQYLSDTLFVTSDGGIYFSPNNGTSYTNISGGLQINQPYRISCSQLSYDEILMGQQDNGVVLWSNGNVDFVGGGDGGTSLINPMDDDNQFYANNSDHFYFTTNHWDDTHYFTTPGDYSGSYFKCIAIRPEDTVYYGGKDVWKSVQKGYNMTKIMDLPDTTNIKQIAIAPTDGDFIYVLNSEHLWLTEDGGGTYISLNPSLPAAPGQIIRMEVNAANPDMIWIALSGWGDGVSVCKSSDGGNSWSNFSEGLPDCPISDIIQNALQTNYDELYASCYFGVYVKLGDNPWIPYYNGLPDVNPFDIDIYYNGSNSKLRAGTHGRGIWESNLFSVDNTQPYVWTGIYSTDWNDYRNWNFMTVPSTDVDVILPQGTARNAHIYTNNAYCRNIVIERGARLNITNKQLIVSNNMDINDELKFFGTTARIMVEGNITWKSGSSFEASDTACIITVSGDWTFETGSQADLTGTIVRFNGSDFSNLYSNSSGSRFGRFVVNKPVPYSLSFEDPSSEDLVIMDDMIVSANCKYYQNSVRNINVMGDLYAEGDFFQQHGNYRCKDSASLKLVNPSSYLNDFFIDNSSLITLSSDIKIRGNLDIRSGVLNAGSYEVNLWGDLYKDNTGLFSMTTGRLIFSGTSEQKIWDDFEIKTVEVDKITDTLRIPTGRNVVFENFDWTAGVISLDADSHVELEEMIDDGIWGSYIVKTNAFLDIHNPTGSVDLNGKLVINGGTVNVYGGNHASYWPGSANAELQMSGGVLDFKNRGIFILDHPSFSLTDNITGGTIRTCSSFQGDNTSFNPAGGQIELYSSSGAELSHGPGSSFYKIIVNKGAMSGFQQENGEREITASKVTVASNLDLDNDLVITSGELDTYGYTVNVGGKLDIYGKLTMTDPASVIQSDIGFIWNAGSSSNITAGLIKLITSWNFKDGTNAQMTGSNKVIFIGGGNSDIYSKDADACFASLICDKTSGTVLLDASGNSFPTVVNNNFTLKNGNTLRVDGADLVVNGTLLTETTAAVTITSGGTISAANATINNAITVPGGAIFSGSNLNLAGEINLSTGGNLTFDNLDLSGTLEIDDGNALIHTDFGQSSAGHLILNDGTFIIDKPYTGTLFSFSGTTDLNGGFFEISNDGIQFGSGALVNFNGGNLRIGGHFTATNPNCFKPSSGAVEFINTIGSNINISNGNYFHKLIINKSSTNPCYPSTDLIINDDLEITAGELQTLNKTLNIGDDLFIGSNGKLTAGSSTINVNGDWINNRGTVGFAEGTSSVWLNSSQPCQVSTETFYNLDLDKPLGWNQFADLIDGSVLSISHFLTIGDGTLRMNNNCTLNLNGDLHLKSGGGLNANAVATGTVINCYGNWEDYNTVWSPFVGFAAGQSTAYLKGNQVQEFNATGGVRFYNLTIQKTAESFIPYNNITVVNNFNQISGQWRQAVSNLNFTFGGSFTLSDPSLWLDQVNTLIFDGSNYQTLLVNSPGWMDLGSLVVDKSIDAGILDIQSDISCSNKMKVIRGEAAFDGYRLQCADSLAVFQDGTLNFFGSASISMGDNGNIYLSGGNMNIWGSDEDRATVSRSGSGYYEFLIENGGQLEASYTDFEYMGSRGIDFEGTGILGGTLPLNYCSFSKGEAFGTLLIMNNSQDVYLHNTIFPVNTWSGTNNVSKSENSGNVFLPDATGDYAGPAFEYDPYNRVHWPAAGIWDGDVSTQWHNAQNWRYNFQIPDASTDVVIPSGCLYYPVFSNPDTTVNSLLMEPYTTLTLQKDTLRVRTWADIAGTLNMTGNYTGLFIDSLVWQRGSSASMVDKATIYLTGDMFIRQGSDLNLSHGLIYFYGNGESNLICHDSAQICDLSNFKMNPYSLSLVGDTLAQLTVNGSFTNGNATTLRCPSSQEWVFNGNFRNTANGHFRCSNGTVKLRGSISSTYFRLKPGDYFNNLTIETPISVNLYYTTGYSDTLRVNGDLTINPRSGGTSGIQANQFKIVMRGDWINNAGTSAFVTGAGQTHSVIFWEPYERQEIRGNTNFITIGIANESEDGVHSYGQINALSILVTNPLWSHGTFTVNSADIDDNLSAIHLTDGSVMQIGNLNQGGLIHVHNGNLTVNDLNQNYITGSYVIDNGSMILKQSEYTTTHDLYFANITVNGGTLTFSGGNGQSKWPSASGGVSTLTMTGGLFYLLNHSVEIMPGNFTENISGGTIRLPGYFIGDANVNSFHPSGGIVELYDDWDADCGFLEPTCWFHDLYVNKSADAGVYPFYQIRVKNHLRLIQGNMQLYGNPVLVGP